MPTPIAPLTRSSTPPAGVRLARALDAAARTWTGRTVLRAEVEIAPVDALAWLAAQEGGPAHTWHAREAAEARAAWGAALTVEADTLDGVTLPDLPPGARLYGAARFAPEAPVAAEWASFGRIRFVLPRVELRTDGRTAVLAVHLAPGEAIASARLDLDALRPALPPPALVSPPQPFARGDAPDRAGWTAAIAWALDAFEGERLNKVVLARRSRYTFAETLDPFDLLRRLQSGTPRCFHALVAPPGGGSAFLTATPERLFRLSGRTVETEAVAGTRPRSTSDADDDRLRAELLASDKDQREHAFVRDAILHCLGPLTSALEADGEASAMTLARGRHLYTGIRGTLTPEATALDLLCALHPTPAVGGTPRRAAEATIARLEPFDRGLYAGPVGWLGRDAQGREAAEFAVGIRSGLVRRDTLSLYAGAGIVAGSEARAEWDEIEHKAAEFARVFGLRPALAA